MERISVLLETNRLNLKPLPFTKGSGFFIRLTCDLCTYSDPYFFTADIYEVDLMAPSDPRRPDKVYRYQKDAQVVGGSSEYFNAIGMVCSLVGLLMKVYIPHNNYCWLYSTPTFNPPV